MDAKSYRIHIRQGEFELDVEGDRAFVEAYAEAFLAEEGELEPMQESAPRGRRKSEVLPARENTPKAPIGDVHPEKQALKAFMKGKKVRSNKERYLHYMRFLHAEGAREVGDRDIGVCFSAEGLPMPPTGRQNFGSLRKEGLVKAGSKRGLWALTAAGLEGRPAGAKKAPGPKPSARKSSKPAAKGARKARGRAASKRVPHAKSPVPGEAAKKRAPRRKKAAVGLPKKAADRVPAPESF